MKRPNLRIIGIEKEETQVKGTKHNYNKITGEKFLSMREHMAAYQDIRII
jgi:hypothetical protein